jgi:alpha-ketoglutarate-dependent 2,4-dichlorophenoxyacetate dioxygenase
MIMVLSIRPLHPTLAAEVSGVDLRTADKALAEDLAAANDRYPVLVFRDQDLDDEAQARFASLFGPSLDPPGRARQIGEVLDAQARARENEHLQRAIGTELWHTDSSHEALPAKYSMLYAVEVPSKGHHTEFADLRAAYDALDDRMKERIDDLVAEHANAFSSALIGYTINERPNMANPPVPQRVTRRLPGSGRRSLYLASHAGNIVGWPMPDSRSLLFYLIDHATKPQFVYDHEWRAHDLVWWDDRCTMHRARPNWDALDELGDMRRVTVADVAPTIEQPSALAG